MEILFWILWAVAVFLVYWVLATLLQSYDADHELAATSLLVFICVCLIFVWLLEPAWRKNWQFPVAILVAEVIYGAIGFFVFREKPIQLDAKKDKNNPMPRD